MTKKKPKEPTGLRDQLKRFEAERICNALSTSNGVAAEAARKLEMPVRTLWRRVSELKIDVGAFR